MNRTLEDLGYYEFKADYISEGRTQYRNHTDVRIEFVKSYHNRFSVYTQYGEPHPISMELYHAITLKLKELGWLDD